MYWIVIGRRVVSGRFQRKLEQLKYGLTGKIPDVMKPGIFLARIHSYGISTGHSIKAHWSE